MLVECTIGSGDGEGGRGRGNVRRGRWQSLLFVEDDHDEICLPAVPNVEETILLVVVDDDER